MNTAWYALASDTRARDVDNASALHDSGLTRPDEKYSSGSMSTRLSTDAASTCRLALS